MSASDDGIFVLGNYKLIEVLGIGAMGYVYRARQLNLDRDVAVKILSPRLAQETSHLELFFREARTAASLEHPNIVPIFDYGVQDSVSYVAMRLLLGGSLGDRIQYRLDRNLSLPSLPEIIAILTQAASALDYAHGRGVIHRDIKPTNLMFDQHGTVYIVDFGIAKLIGTTSSVKGGTFLGTPSFMAPEQWEGATPTPAVDQYALGAVIYTTLTGHPPFESETPLALMNKHLHEIPKDIQVDRPYLPMQINGVLQRAMAKRPEDRFPSATAFAEAFAATVEEPASEKPTGFTSYVLPQTSFPIPFPAPTGLPGTSAPLDVEPLSDTSVTASRLSGRGRNVILWVESALLFVAIALIVLLLVQRSGLDAPPPILSVGVALAQSASPPPPDAPTQLPSSEENIALPQPPVAFTPTATQSPTLLPTASPTTIPVLATSAPTETLTNTFIPSDTPTETATFTAVPSNTPTETATFTPVPSNTPTATFTVVPSDTLTATATFTAVPSDTPTATATATFTAVPSDTPTATATFTSVPSDTPTATATMTPSPTFTSTSAARPTVRWHAGSLLRISNPSGAWLRSRASTYASQVTTLAYNNPVTATGNYFFDGRQWWWQVQASWGAVGWVEQYSLVER